MDQNNDLKLSDVFVLFKKFIFFYKSNRKYNYLIVFGFMVISLLYYTIEKSKFEASASFVLMEGAGSKTAGLSSIGSQFGIDIGSLGGQSNSIFSGDNIFDIFRTKTIVEKVLLSEFNDGSGSAKKKTFADAYITMYPSFTKTILLGKKSPVETFYGYDKNLGTNRLKDSVLNNIFEKVVKNHLSIQKSNKKGSIIQVKIITNNELFSKSFNENLIEAVKTFYININNTNTQIVLSGLQNKADSLQGLLYQKSFKSSSLFNLNSGLIAYSANEELSQKDKTVAYALYSEVIKNIELTKMTQAQQTPIFQILETPRLPLENKKLELFELLFIGLFGGIILSFFYVTLKYILK